MGTSEETRLETLDVVVDGEEDARDAIEDEREGRRGRRRRDDDGVGARERERR